MSILPNQKLINMKKHIKNICLFSLFVLISCNNETNTTNNNDVAVIVGVFNAEARYHSNIFEYSATLKPYREANLGATIPGRVEKINYKVGEYVSKGDIIIEMSAEPMLMAKVEKNAIEKDYLRVKRLKEKGSVTEQDYDHVHAKYEAAKSKLELFENNTRIRAPFSGVIAEHLVNEGENFLFAPGLEIGLSHTSGIVRLMQTDPVLVSFFVNEKDIRNFKKGMKAEITFDAFPEKSFKASITQVGPIVSSLTRTAELQIELGNSEGKLMPGMFARIRIEQPGDTLIFVPRHAVIEHENKHFVWIIEEGKAQQKMVTPILTKQGYTAINNVDAGEKIIVAGINRLSKGIDVVESNN